VLVQEPGLVPGLVRQRAFQVPGPEPVLVQEPQQASGSQPSDNPL